MEYRLPATRTGRAFLATNWKLDNITSFTEGGGSRHKKSHVAREQCIYCLSRSRELQYHG